MPRSRPQMSITLPRNFQFHYTEGNEPKTPENDGPAPSPRSPRAEGAYRIKRRSRPSVNTAFASLSARRPISSDIPIPTIETSTASETTRPPFSHAITEPSGHYLAPKFVTLPRTPSPTPQKPQMAHDWNNQKDTGESISRPMSACSLISDSSDDNDSLTSYPTGDGSCTSPESDSPDPFSSKFTSIKRGKGKQLASLLKNDREIQDGIATKPTNRVQWTSEMDKHLWSTYLVYLQDPTVTPFKMLPGTSPPLGVCHRVAREARRTWRPAVNSNKRKASELLSPSIFEKSQDQHVLVPDLAGRPGSPDTIKPVRSGSNTPTRTLSASSMPPKSLLWPKSGSSTRRRLRYLSKRKPSIAPHYRRILQSRSPSPFSSSSRMQTRSQSRLSEVTSPATMGSSPFNTRDIQFSLTTSTADTMQPDGPLAQLSKGADLPSPPPPNNSEWFNEPPVPFASGPAIPSDVIDRAESVSMDIRESIEDEPRLGSPFNGYHTWGPSRTKQRSRPSTARIQSSDAMTVGPFLRSPVRFHGDSPPQGIHKRRARHQLEDELSPGGSSMQQSLLDNLFGSPSGGRHRRVRSRGFSLGDVDPGNPLASIFTPPSSEKGNGSLTDVSSTPASSILGSDDPVTPTPQIRRLGSPFNGIAPRPQRVRGPSRHMAAASLGQYDVGAFSSIGETLQHSEMMDRGLNGAEQSTDPS